MSALKEDILTSELVTNPADDLDVLVSQYNTCLKSILDIHAPIETITLKPKKNPWYSQEIHILRQNKRAFQRKFKKTRADSDLHNLIQCRDDLKSLIRSTKVNYFSKLINDAQFDQGNLFRRVKSMLNKKNSVPIPENTSETEFCNELNEFFITKIEAIRAEFNDLDNTHCHDFDETAVSQPLRKLEPVTIEKVVTMVSKSASKTCDLDPCPTSVLKLCITELAPTITDIINLSLQSAKVPTALKHATVTPRLKKPTLPTVPKSFRPVSNLPYISKLIEQAVLDQLNTHFDRNNLVETYQSGYKAKHSTETALLYITNNLLQKLDQNEAILIAFLDLSAAFDVVDHRILLDRLNKSQGIEEDALQWIKSYLSGRTQQVRIGESQ